MVPVKTKNKVPAIPPEELFDRVQVNVRMNRRLVKVLRGAAEYFDMPFSALLENIAVTALDGQCPFDPDSLKRIEQLKKVYGFDELLAAMSAAAREAERQDDR